MFQSSSETSFETASNRLVSCLVSVNTKLTYGASVNFQLPPNTTGFASKAQESAMVRGEL